MLGIIDGNWNRIVLCLKYYGIDLNWSRLNWKEVIFSSVLRFTLFGYWKYRNVVGSRLISRFLTPAS